MKVGDLVRHKRSERGMTGIIVGFLWHSHNPVVLWDEGRCNWCVSRFLEVVND